MANGIPVIANSRCEVLKSHIEKSFSGYLYDNYENFASSLYDVMNKNSDELKEMGLRGADYVAQNYSWNEVLKKLQKTINLVSGS